MHLYDFIDILKWAQAAQQRPVQKDRQLKLTQTGRSYQAQSITNTIHKAQYATSIEQLVTPGSYKSVTRHVCCIGTNTPDWSDML